MLNLLRIVGIIYFFVIQYYKSKQTKQHFNEAVKHFFKNPGNLPHLISYFTLLMFSVVPSF